MPLKRQQPIHGHTRAQRPAQGRGRGSGAAVDCQARASTVIFVILIGAGKEVDMTASGIALEELAARVPDGASIVAPADTNGVPMALVRALIRRGASGLHLIGGPTSGQHADLLIGAGCLDSIETAAVSLGEFGAAPRFRAAAEGGGLRVLETTCPALHASLQAAEKGVPFMPLRGLIGSDIVRVREDWRVIDNPFAAAEADPIVLLPAIVPDVALIHAALADREGNVWIGLRREAMTMARAARHALVTVEEWRESNLLDDPVCAPGTLPSLYVDAVTLCPHGAWPVGFADRYGPDAAHLRAYAAEARTEAGFAGYLDRHVFAESAAAAE
jgi:glutaconate CoA-transferase subunit A